ncbi:GntR family transcriptional regulator [Roseibium sp. CAU 1637]|uniref:GntR family transcriptional regulator n=1 Tax=Roseibium limicola TaxID=2816037 RepID=A0A939EL90_9HYPH|nr:GntR family transcriptional regulator [Roseibium limicola]MBO0344502.1 GntR family transcriptional regulator [Roseibium limicola]
MSNSHGVNGAGVFKALEATDLVQQIARQIAEAIVQGKLKPGERLTELRLSKEFGTSRAPVREAARLLESQGLVVSQPRRGFFVRTLSSRDLYDIYELRLGLEIHGALLALDRIGEREIDMLKRQVEKLYQLADQGFGEEQIAEDYTFHRMLCAFSGNARLLKVYDDIAIDMRAGITLIGQLYDDPHKIAQTHEPILEALERGDPMQLTAALRFHIGVARDHVVPLFADIET